MAAKSINRRPWCIAPVLGAFILLAGSAAAQQASEAERNAIRRACPADYKAHCANVPAAGRTAFSCLVHNIDKLSPLCKRAVRAVSTGSSGHALPPRLNRQNRANALKAAQITAILRKTPAPIAYAKGGHGPAVPR